MPQAENSLANLQSNSVPTAGETLWHYTSAEACYSILESNTLRLMNVRTYRSRPDTEADWQEFEHGLQCFSFIQYQKPADLVWSNLNELVELYSPFVMCFSKSDVNDTLWNERASTGGVSLGVSSCRSIAASTASRSNLPVARLMRSDISLSSMV